MYTKLENTDQLNLFPAGMTYPNDEARKIIMKAEQMRSVVLTLMVRDMFRGIKHFLVDGIAHRIRVARTARELNELSDSMLADIGLHRSQILSVSEELANGTYYRDPADAATVATEDKADADKPAAANHNEPELPLAA